MVLISDSFLFPISPHVKEFAGYGLSLERATAPALVKSMQSKS